MFVFASGKGLRPFIPFVALLGVTALVLLALREHTWAKWLLFVISVATIGPLLWPRRALSRLPAPVAWLRYFIEGHAASLIGAVQYMAGLRSAKKPAPSSCSSRIKG